MILVFSQWRSDLKKKEKRKAYQVKQHTQVQVAGRKKDSI